MNFSNLINQTLAEMDEEFEDLNGFSFHSSDPHSKSSLLLREYTEKLLENYHHALQIELHNKGIDI